MSAIGAATSVGFAPATVQAVAQPSPSSAPVRQPGSPSGIAGHDFSGDPLTDQVLATFASDPLGFGSLDGAMDTVSASMSFNPARGFDQRAINGTSVAIMAGNALSALPPSAAGTMSVPEVIARSESTIARGYTSMLGSLHDGNSAQEALGSFAAELRHGLRRDERGMTSYDHTIAALEVQKQEIARKLKERVGDPRVLMARMLSLTIAQGMVQREREKVEELLKLIVSLMLGVQVPKGCVERLQALGLGPLVEKIIQDMVGNGKSLSKGMRDSIEALGGMGIDISMVQEQDTEVGLRRAQRERELHASISSDGRLVDRFGTTVDANAVRGDLADALRRRAAGFDGGDLQGGLLATAGSNGVVSGSPTDGATGV